MMIDLYHYSLLSIFLVGLAVVLIAGEIGWQLGVRAEGAAARTSPPWRPPCSGCWR